MRSLLRPAHLFLLLTYIALSAVPFVPLLLGQRVERPWQLAGIEVIAWVAIWAAFKRPAYFHWLLAPAFLALPTELYLITYYGQGISTHHLGIIAETSPKEALEFLGQKVWLMAAVMIGAVAWFVASLRAARGTRSLDWTDSSRWVALAVLAAGASVWAYGDEFGIAPKPAPAKSSVELVKASVEKDSAPKAAGRTGLKLPPLARWARLPVEFDAFAQSWPFGLASRGVDFYKERVYLAELGRRSASFRFGAHQQSPDAEPETVVLVLGESSRADRWSLNGYERDTNPLLRQEANLVALPDVVTAVSATRLSVPVIISRKRATQSLKDGFSEKSFITAYKEAGFKTFWLSNQISFGKFDTPVSVFAKEADVVEFLNLGGFTNSSNFDQVLFDPFRNALADKAPKKLIVVHSLGSHWNYSQRYPKQFDQWQPSLFGIDKPVYTDVKIKPQLNNSYDSSILYTDWFLDQLIGQMKQSQQRAAMLYVSDHGQTLYDNSCRLAFHGHNTQFEFHVPAFVWYSDQYQARYPGKVEQLALHKGERLATENMFHTLLDMGDIRYPGDTLEWSFLNAQFRHHKRLVDSYGWTNYDNATFKGDCREVIDKDKPLKQDK
ncbi:phosphoethanolamine transferase [Massilia sp. R2A-15]|uniref:phosphoethanolamine transferase n=1 Tax=Massilia sp. R2A-15 TaxID=3064278 RepID=UPI0027361DD4|nr:phosphoethanolamine transferase [Massilia sp. R2A-15]WLI89393.1 phosphoethanolamine transferase [Massilia sp. R2A-15]